MPILQLWSEQFKARGLRVVGVTEMSTDADVIKQALAEVGVKYPAVTDHGERIANAYKVTAHPTTYFVDRRGVIRHAEEGFLKGDEVEMLKVLEKLLAEPKPKPTAKSTRKARKAVRR